MPEEKYVEVDGQKFVDDGTGSPKLDDDGQSIPFVEEEKTVPYSRFKEVNEDKKTAEQKLETLEKDKKPELTPEQQKEAKAKDYLKGLIKEERKAVLAEEKEAETKGQQKFDDEVADVLADNTDIKKDEFLKFIEDSSEKYGITTVKGAMSLYKKFGEVKDKTAEETKDELDKRPKLPKSEGATPPTKVDDSNKTFQEVVNEEMRGLESKGQEK